MDLLDQIAEELELGEDESVGKLTQEALDRGIPAKSILDDGLIKGMTKVGVLFRNHEVFLPDVLLAAKAMYAGLDLIKPLLKVAGVRSNGTIVLGTVQGDIHDIGKNLVAIMLKGAGFEVIDLGQDVTPEAFIAAAESHQAQAIGMSALLTTTMPVMKEVVALVKAKGLESKVKTVIGGAPVNENFAQEIGATAYSYDAAHAVEVFKQILEP